MYTIIVHCLPFYEPPLKLYPTKKKKKEQQIVQTGPSSRQCALSGCARAHDAKNALYSAIVNPHYHVLHVAMNRECDCHQYPSELHMAQRLRGGR